jgi:hypothetical protein
VPDSVRMWYKTNQLETTAKFASALPSLGGVGRKS